MKKAMIKSFSEAELASFQTLQQGNDCALHAISSAIRLLTDACYVPADLIKLADRLWWVARFYRLYPGGGIFPHMQVGLLNYLIRRDRLSLSAPLSPLPDILRNLPYDDDLAALVTVYWLPRRAPGIFRRQLQLQLQFGEQPGGPHNALSAYDPDHYSGEKWHTPWGFINSWIDGGTDLF